MTVTAFTTGNQLLREGKLEEAIASYEKAIELNPQFAWCYQNVGDALEKAGRIDEAIAVFRRAVANCPESPWCFYKLGVILGQQGEFQEGVGYLRQAIELKKDVPEFYLGLGSGLVKLGQWSEAVDCINQAMGMWDGKVRRLHLSLQAEADFYLAEAKSGLGQWSEAVEFYGRSLEVNPGRVECYLGWAAALGKLGRWSEAVELYRQGMVLFEESGELWFCLGKALGQLERWEEAVVEYGRSVGLGFAGAEVRHHLGYALEKLGRWEEAVVQYRWVLEVNQKSAVVKHQLGYALMQLGRWGEAEIELRKAAGLHPGSAAVWQHLGDVLGELGERDEAVEVYRKALELNPNDLSSLKSLADAQYQASSLQEDLSKKITSSDYLQESSAQLDPDKNYGYYLKAIALNPEHLPNYHKAIAIKPQNYELYLKLGNALLRQNKTYGAIALYKLAQTLQPDDSKISVQLEEALKKCQLEVQTAPIISNDIGSDRQSKTTSPQLSIRHSYTYNTSSDDVYAQWLRENSPTAEDIGHMTEIAKVLKYKPLISIVMPVYNTDEVFLHEAILSVIDQIYPHWELCIADDASPKPHVKEILNEYAATDQRIKVVFRSENGHISACSNSALKLASGEFIALLDHDDILTPDALFHMVFLLNAHLEADMIYSDEDKLNEKGERLYPYFKPDWSPELFLSQMYTCHLGIYRRSIINEIGGFREEYAGCQDYDLVLRFTEKTDQIFHIPKILYHWRIHSLSSASGAGAKPYVYKLIEKLLLETIRRRGENGQIIQVPNYPGQYFIRYDIAEYKLVSIIIPTQNFGSGLNTCLKSIFEKSTYPNYEIVVIDNCNSEAETLSVLEFWQREKPEKLRYYRLDAYSNYSYLNNYAITKARGDYLLFLNQEIEVITSDWMERMVEQTQRKPIGAVGALLLYPYGLIRNAGLLMGVCGVVGQSHHGFSSEHPGYFGKVINVNNYSAMSGACLMFRREVFEEIGGFDEDLAVAYNDVDLCLKMLEKNYRNVYLPHVVLYDHNNSTEGNYDYSPERQNSYGREAEIMRLKWGELIDNDPYYNPNLSKEKTDYSLQIQKPPLVEVVTVLKEQSELLMGYSIDSPSPGKWFYDDLITIKGWVLGQSSKAIKVRSLCDDQVLGESIVNGHRPDVLNAYPQSENEYAGFEIQVKLRKVSPKGELKMQAVLQDGICVPMGALELQILLVK